MTRVYRRRHQSLVTRYLAVSAAILVGAGCANDDRAIELAPPTTGSPADVHDDRTTTTTVTVTTLAADMPASQTPETYRADETAGDWGGIVRSLRPSDAVTLPVPIVVVAVRLDEGTTPEQFDVEAGHESYTETSLLARFEVVGVWRYADVDPTTGVYVNSAPDVPQGSFLEDDVIEVRIFRGFDMPGAELPGIQPGQRAILFTQLPFTSADGVTAAALESAFPQRSDGTYTDAWGSDPTDAVISITESEFGALLSEGAGQLAEYYEAGVYGG